MDRRQPGKRDPAGVPVGPPDLLRAGRRERSAASPGRAPSSPSASQSTGAASDGPPIYIKEFLDSLSEEAREHLQKLYNMGVLKETDPIARQERYVKAMQKAEGNVKAGFEASNKPKTKR